MGAGTPMAQNGPLSAILRVQANAWGPTNERYAAAAPATNTFNLCVIGTVGQGKCCGIAGVNNCLITTCVLAECCTCCIC